MLPFTSKLQGSHAGLRLDFRARLPYIDDRPGSRGNVNLPIAWSCSNAGLLCRSLVCLTSSLPTTKLSLVQAGAYCPQASSRPINSVNLASHVPTSAFPSRDRKQHNRCPTPYPRIRYWTGQNLLTNHIRRSGLC